MNAWNDGWMAPSELAEKLNAIDQRVRSCCTAAVSLLTLALVAGMASVWVASRQNRTMAVTVVALALAGCAGAALIASLLRLSRRRVYEEIILSGFRHVRPQAVARRCAELVSRTRRRRLAEALDRLVDVAEHDLPAPVPINRMALRDCRTLAAEISSMLRADDVEIEPAGVVLLQRLITDGAASPLYDPTGTVRDLERELDRIAAHLAPDQPGLAA
jgi:hypothetical protein